MAAEPITRRAYARIGLLGNPSGALPIALYSPFHAAAASGARAPPAACSRADGYNGKCISLSLENYYAEVRAHPRAHPRPRTPLAIVVALDAAAVVCGPACA